MNNISLIDTSTSEFIKMCVNAPYLSEEEEYHLAIMKDKGDKNAAEKLILSHLRLVVKIAYDFKNYNIAMDELISEGIVGLMNAVKKFEPSKQVRLCTYATYWIKSYLYLYIYNNSSIITYPYTRDKKCLFYKLKSIKKEFLNNADGVLSDEDIKIISKNFNIKEHDVKAINNLVYYGDKSLNDVVYNDEEYSIEEIDNLQSEEENQYEILEKKDFNKKLHNNLESIFCDCSDREKDIFYSRNINEEKIRLKELGKKHGITRERVRQIEKKMLKKLEENIEVFND